MVRRTTESARKQFHKVKTRYIVIQVETKEDTFLANVLSAGNNFKNGWLRKIGKPVDPNEYVLILNQINQILKLYDLSTKKNKNPKLPQARFLLICEK